MLPWVSQLSCIPLSGTPYITLTLSRVDIDDITLICKHIQHMKHKVSYLGFISYHKIVVVLTWLYWFKIVIVMWKSYRINLFKNICLEAVFLWGNVVMYSHMYRGSYKPRCKLFLGEFSFILCTNVQFDKTFSYWQTKYDIQQKNLCTLVVQKILLKKDKCFSSQINSWLAAL